jgi:UDP-N-acetylenolpyruvoylglucosamine reductase
MNRKDFLKISSLLSLSLVPQVKNALKLLPTAEGYVDDSENVTYVYAGEKDYDALRQGCNLRISNKPTAIAICKNAKGVAEAIKFAKQKKLTISVKSGGHCMEALSCITGSLVINMSMLTQIEWVNTNTIKVQPGCTLQKLYAEIIPKGKILPGGSCGKVGIGGLSLGGGYGLMSRQYGLTCDSLIEAEMVDGKGNIVNTTTNPELLWALKGGGNGNYGVVTSLTFALNNAPATMQSYRFREKKLTLAKAKLVLKTWFDITKDLPTQCFSAFVLNHTTAYILLTHTGSENAVIKKAVASLKKVTSIFSGSPSKPLQAALKNYYAEQEPVYFKNASAGLYKNYEDVAVFFDDVFEKIRSKPGLIYQVNTLGGKVKNEAFKNASSFPHRDYNYFSELQSYWQKPSQEAALVKIFDDIQIIIDPNGNRAQYRNYADLNYKNPLQQYYGSSLTRLQAIKKRYDADDIFSHKQTVR